MCGRRNASNDAAAKTPSSSQVSELESGSSLETPVSDEIVKSFDPVKTAKSRKTQLPKSRYVCLG